MSKVGFVGMGIMGRPMSLNLIRAGHELYVHSRHGAPQEILDAGATACDSGMDVAKAERGLLPAEAPFPAPMMRMIDRIESYIPTGGSKGLGLVVGRVAVGEGPHEIAASTDGKLAFVGNYGAQSPGSTISVIDLIGQKELRRVDLGPLRRPHGMFFADGKVYFTAEVNKLIGRYDPATNQIDWLMGTGQNSTHMVIVSKDNNRIFTSNIGSDSISVIERASGPAAWTETVIPVGKGPEAIDISPDEKEIWLSDAFNRQMHVFDATVTPPKQILSIPLRDEPGWVTFGIDGRYAYPSTGDVIDVKSRKIVATLQDENGKDVQSEKLLEIDFANGKPVRA